MVEYLLIGEHSEPHTNHVNRIPMAIEIFIDCTWAPGHVQR